MPEEGGREVWDGARYQREKRSFIERRLLFRFVHLHAAVIFAVTGLAGWALSWALLRLGVASMPLRYAIGFVAAYGVFLLCVRVWADEMRSERGTNDWTLDAAPGDGEGCLLVLAAFVAGLFVAGLFALMGGASLLLEVAFEVVFAGVVVRRLGRREHVGNWAGRLVRGTWLPALVAALLLVSAAGWLQHQAPGARTLLEAVRPLLQHR